jgi:hypothetical protein
MRMAVNIEAFWTLIDAAYEESGPFVEEYDAALQTALSSLSPDELVSFDQIFSQLLSTTVLQVQS